MRFFVVAHTLIVAPLKAVAELLSDNCRNIAISLKIR